MTTNQVDSKQMVRFTFIVQPIDPTKKNKLGFLSWCFSPVNHPSGKCIGGALACAKGTLCGGAKGIPRYMRGIGYASICIPIWILS